MVQSKQILNLPIESLRPNPRQPRRHFDPKALQELSASIRRHGILQPLTVRRTAQGWELVAGERRLRAARLAGCTSVPCIEAEADEGQSALLALIENLQRQDLHYFEEAAAIARYLHDTGVTQEEAAARLGRSASAVANKLRLLRLDDECRSLCAENGLTERHARCLLRLTSPDEQRAAARHFIAAALNVAQAEQYVERRLQSLQTTPRRRTFILKDVRLFLNSVDRSVRLVRQAGIDARTGREETPTEIVLTIRIPKKRSS